jgi:hypothetical protein
MRAVNDAHPAFAQFFRDGIVRDRSTNHASLRAPELNTALDYRQV